MSVLKIKDTATGQWQGISSIQGPQGEKGDTAYGSVFGVDGINVIIDEEISDHVDLYLTRNDGTYIVRDKYHLAETYDTGTGAVIEAPQGSRYDFIYTKPGSLLLVTKNITVCYFTLNGEYLGLFDRNTGNKGKTYTVPENCYKLGICSPNYVIPPMDSLSVYNYVKTNCRVPAIQSKFENEALDLSDVRGLGDVPTFEAKDTNTYLKWRMIKANNQMRHAFRIASFNIKGTGGNGQNNWDALKTYYQKYGVDIAAMQEVFKPMGEDNTKVLSTEMASWHLKHFTEQSVFPTNERVVAATGEFTLVSAAETRYTTQGGYGNRYYLRSEWRLPYWKSKKWSQYLKMSVYSTQLETSTATAKAQARELLAAMQADPNPFVVLTGDFNDFTTDQSVWAVFSDAGFEAALKDTSSPTAGRGFYDNIFVNDRISIVGNDVVPSDANFFVAGGNLPMSDHDMVLADIVLDYSNVIAVKTVTDHCTITGVNNWLDRRTEGSVVVTVTPDEGYTLTSINAGHGDNDVNYGSGIVTVSGNTVTIVPSRVVGDVWIIPTLTASE